MYKPTRTVPGLPLPYSRYRRQSCPTKQQCDITIGGRETKTTTTYPTIPPAPLRCPAAVHEIIALPATLPFRHSYRRQAKKDTPSTYNCTSTILNFSPTRDTEPFANTKRSSRFYSRVCLLRWVAPAAALAQLLRCAPEPRHKRRCCEELHRRRFCRRHRLLLPGERQW